MAFSERQNSGQIVETLNDHLSVCEAPIAPPSEPRVKLTANTDLKKFSYKPMAMHLSEASEVLDDRIDEFQLLVQAHHYLEDSAFGNAANQATSEIVAVGRISSESIEGKLNASSLMLETSRRTGAGLRIPLKVEGLSTNSFLDKSLRFGASMPLDFTSQSMKYLRFPSYHQLRHCHQPWISSTSV